MVNGAPQRSTKDVDRGTYPDQGKTMPAPRAKNTRSGAVLAAAVLPEALVVVVVLRREVVRAAAALREVAHHRASAAYSARPHRSAITSHSAWRR